MSGFPCQVRVGGIACQYTGSPGSGFVREQCHISIVANVLVTRGTPTCAEFQVVDNCVVAQE